MSESVEVPVSAQQKTPAGKRTSDRPRPGEWAIAVFMLVFFAAGYLFAQDWPFRAALFPMMISVVGLAMSLLRVVGLVLQTIRGRKAASDIAIVPSTTAALVVEQPQDTSAEAKQVRTAAVEGHERGVTEPAQGTPAVTIVDDEAEEDESMEYVFATAGGRAWASALAWIVAFFVLFFAIGVFFAVPVFALVYLRFSGRASWLAAAVYAVVTGFLIYALFRWVVYINLPTGFIPFLEV